MQHQSGLPHDLHSETSWNMSHPTNSCLLVFGMMRILLWISPLAAAIAVTVASAEAFAAAALARAAALSFLLYFFAVAEDIVTVMAAVDCEHPSRSGHCRRPYQRVDAGHSCAQCWLMCVWQWTSPQRFICPADESSIQLMDAKPIRSAVLCSLASRPLELGFL